MSVSTAERGKQRKRDRQKTQRAVRKLQQGGGRFEGTTAITIKELLLAVRAVENDGHNRGPLLEHFVRRAYSNDAVLLGLFKKLIPDLKSFDALMTVMQDKMSPELRDAIRGKLLDRFKSKNGDDTNGIDKDK